VNSVWHIRHPHRRRWRLRPDSLGAWAVWGFGLVAVTTGCWLLLIASLLAGAAWGLR